MVAAARFVSNGPILTVTIKDSAEEGSSKTGAITAASFLSSSTDDDTSDGNNPWFNLSNFRPNLVWSLKSQGKPLPNWFPNWQSLRTTVGYQYEPTASSHQRLPSFVEADLKFSSERLGVELEVQPSYEFKTQQSGVSVRASRGAAAYLMGKFASQGERWLQLVRGCYQTELPYGSVGAVRITPTFDLAQGQASCLLEAMTASQRTKAILNLEYDNPTLTVVHSLDDRNTIAPEISLFNARILYQWNIALDSGSIRTKVDPTSAVQVTWTDNSLTGKWITDVRVPLAGTTLSSLSADVRVRRQFSF
ncbi:hypothetical protein IV203_022577 [Nitzschia inconspicua]|uniref:Uncharacterized protein n=1 Tax=Nitzschia inconspicua TaxID=303405 RepID=A0A9K3KIY7_9STRA|nr:hypothetical protein IV203_022577 [Nitzschia inconspicua]